MLDLAPLLIEVRRDDYGGTGLVSVHAATLDGQLLASYDDDAVHVAASTIKLPLAMAAYRLHDRGELDLDRPVPVHDDFASRVPGERFVMDPGYDQDPTTWAERGGTCPLRELVRRALVHSGNLATNLVLEHVGLEAVAELLADAGCSRYTLMGRGIEDGPARSAGFANEVTARDLGALLGCLGDPPAARSAPPWASPASSSCRYGTGCTRPSRRSVSTPSCRRWRSRPSGARAISSRATTTGSRRS